MVVFDDCDFYFGVGEVCGEWWFGLVGVDDDCIEVLCYDVFLCGCNEERGGCKLYVVLVVVCG